MPVTARLSKLFYDRLGEGIAMDLNELNFSRFDVRQEQRLAVLDAKWDVWLSGFEARIERRLGEQTRWLAGAWVVVLAAVIGLWLK